jgi:hypothetical protein
MNGESPGDRRAIIVPCLFRLICLVIDRNIRHDAPQASPRGTSVP